MVEDLKDITFDIPDNLLDEIQHNIENAERLVYNIEKRKSGEQ